MEGPIKAYLDAHRTYPQRECTICKCEITLVCVTADLDCGHQFHTACIGEWFKSDHSCPICRDVIDIAGAPAKKLQQAMDAKATHIDRCWLVTNIPPPERGEPKDYVETCAVCREPFTSACLDCQVRGNTAECFVTYGTCGHKFHTHCRLRLNFGGGKLARICPIDNDDWETEAIVPVRVLRRMAKADAKAKEATAAAVALPLSAVRIYTSAAPSLH